MAGILDLGAPQSQAPTQQSNMGSGIFGGSPAPQSGGMGVGGAAPNPQANQSRPPQQQQLPPPKDFSQGLIEWANTLAQMNAQRTAEQSSNSGGNTNVKARNDQDVTRNGVTYHATYDAQNNLVGYKSEGGKFLTVNQVENQEYGKPEAETVKK